jgi:hypothetical protein
MNHPPPSNPLYVSQKQCKNKIKIVRNIDLQIKELSYMNAAFCFSPILSGTRHFQNI